MTDYIIREAAIKTIEEKQRELCPLGMFSRHAVYGSDREKFDAWEEIIEQMEQIPAADVRPVVRGKWLNDFCGKGRFSKRIVQCSLCGNFLDLDGVNAGRGDANYCPNCGADMREPPKEET